MTKLILNLQNFKKEKINVLDLKKIRNQISLMLQGV